MNLLPRHLVWFAILLLGLLRAAAPALANDAQPLEDAKRALGGRTTFPFYDAEKDDVKRMDLKVDTSKAPPPQGSQKWTKTRTTPAAPIAPRGTASGLGMLLQVVGLTLLSLIIVALIVLLVLAFLNGEQTQTAGTKFIDTSGDVDRVEDLPFQLKKPTGDFLSEAQRLYEAGKYSEAIVYLFSYQLVALDKRHVIRLAKGKTNRQYLRETRTREPLKQLLQRTMISFEDVFFGHHDLSRERFEECWRQLDEFHTQLERVEAAAA